MKNNFRSKILFPLLTLLVLSSCQLPTDSSGSNSSVIPNSSGEPSSSTPSETSFSITFVTNGDDEISTLYYEAGESIILPAPPAKADFLFDGWFIDEELTQPFDLSVMPRENLIIYVAWRPYLDLSGEETGFHSDAYGNSNANLHNRGLVVYDMKRKLHYLSIENHIRSYDPLTKVTLGVIDLQVGHRPIYLNYNKSRDLLYYVDSLTQELWEYNFTTAGIRVLTPDPVTYAMFVGEGSPEYLAYLFDYKISDDYYITSVNKIQYSSVDNSVTVGYNYTSLGTTFLNVYSKKMYYQSMDNPLILKSMADGGGSDGAMVNLSTKDAAFTNITEFIHYKKCQ